MGVQATVTHKFKKVQIQCEVGHVGVQANLCISHKETQTEQVDELCASEEVLWNDFVKENRDENDARKIKKKL